MNWTRRKVALLVGLGALVLVSAAVSVATGGTTAAAPSVRPGDFVADVTNPYMPLVPGTVFRYQGHVDKAPSAITVTVTRERKSIEGVSALVIDDVVSVRGKDVERTTDYYAQDTKGNVWYFGEDSFDLEKGKWVRSDGSWLAGVDGAKPGIIMEARPKVGDVYQQEFYAGHAEDMAEVLSTDSSVSVPYGSFERALVTREWTPLEPGVTEHKYYAAGVGNVKTVMVEGGDEEYELVSVTR
jgi:hypothetical protein